MEADNHTEIKQAALKRLPGYAEAGGGAEWVGVREGYNYSEVDWISGLAEGQTRKLAGLTEATNHNMFFPYANPVIVVLDGNLKSLFQQLRVESKAREEKR